MQSVTNDGMAHTWPGIGIKDGTLTLTESRRTDDLQIFLCLEHVGLSLSCLLKIATEKRLMEDKGRTTGKERSEKTEMIDSSEQSNK